MQDLSIIVVQYDSQYNLQYNFNQNYYALLCATQTESLEDVMAAVEEGQRQPQGGESPVQICIIILWCNPR